MFLTSTDYDRKSFRNQILKDNPDNSLLIPDNFDKAPMTTTNNIKNSLQHVMKKIPHTPK